MDKDDWWFPVFALILVVVSAGIGVIYGHQAGVENALVRVCNQTKGKYDFCIKEEVYSIKVPEYNEGTPIFGMSK